jgi:transposase
MSISILYHAFNIKGVKIEKAQYKGNAIIFSAEMTGKYTTCANCRCRHANYKGQKTRTFRMGPFGRKQSFLNLRLHRLQCCDCNKKWWPHLPFMVGKYRYTSSFVMTALDLLRFGTIKDDPATKEWTHS